MTKKRTPRNARAGNQNARKPAELLRIRLSCTVLPKTLAALRARARTPELGNPGRVLDAILAAAEK